MTKIELAAGGLVVRKSPRGREVLLIDDAYGKITFPKGHLERGETWEAAAIREIAEETGIEARIIAPLGRVEYSIQRDDEPIRKQVRLFLLEAVDVGAEPKHQQEEVHGAHYADWDAARLLHGERGYSNWSWVFDKAEALLAWHGADLETKWRGLKADVEQAVVDRTWHEAEPIVRRLVKAVHAELAVTFPAGSRPDSSDAVVLPRAFEATPATLAATVEHTLLKPEASAVDITNLCAEAATHDFVCVCVNPQHVQLAAAQLADARTKVCTVVGFPLGATTPRAIAAETADAIASGANEIDMVIPIGSMKEDDVWTVHEHVAAVVQAARSGAPGIIVKAILETSALSFDQTIKAGVVALAAGADLIKTSTGFHTSGARLADVSAMALVAGPSGMVKASGGVRTRGEAIQMVRYGASRLGTSSGVALTRQ